MTTGLINHNGKIIEDYEEKVMGFEEKLAQSPGALIGHENDAEQFPLKHTFVDGAYVREIFMPAGSLLTSKIHKVRHPFFVLRGCCSVLTDKGVQKITAPYYGITEPGTKRVLYIHEDTVWVTVHVTDSQDLEVIEEQIIAKTFQDLAISQEEVLKLKEG